MSTQQTPPPIIAVTSIVERERKALCWKSIPTSGATFSRRAPPTPEETSAADVSGATASGVPPREPTMTYRCPSSWSSSVRVNGVAVAPERDGRWRAVERDEPLGARGRRRRRSAGPGRPRARARAEACRRGVPGRRWRSVPVAPICAHSPCSRFHPPPRRHASCRGCGERPLRSGGRDEIARDLPREPGVDLRSDSLRRHDRQLGRAPAGAVVAPAAAASGRAGMPASTSAPAKTAAPATAAAPSR